MPPRASGHLFLRGSWQEQFLPRSSKKQLPRNFQQLVPGNRQVGSNEWGWFKKQKVQERERKGQPWTWGQCCGSEGSQGLRSGRGKGLSGDGSTARRATLGAGQVCTQVAAPANLR